MSSSRATPPLTPLMTASSSCEVSVARALASSASRARSSAMLKLALSRWTIVLRARASLPSSSSRRMFRERSRSPEATRSANSHPLLKDTGDFTQDEVDEQGDEQQRAHAAQDDVAAEVAYPGEHGFLGCGGHNDPPVGRAV